MPWRGGVGTSFPELNDGIVAFEDPVAGEELLAIPALPLDFALVYAETADEFGNAQPYGTGNMDHLLGAAAEPRDRPGRPRRLQRRDPPEPERTWRWRDTRVVRAPFGTHPYSNACMVADTEHLTEFIGAAAATPRRSRDYLARYVRDPRSTTTPTSRQIGIRRIASLLV